MSYDRALTVFSPDGHLMQIKYAMEAVQRGAIAVGVQGSDSVILAVERKQATQLQDMRTVKKVSKIDDHIFFAFAGLTADARVLAQRARDECQSYEFNYEEKINVKCLSRHIAHIQQRYTQSGGRRPFGVCAILAGIDSDGPNLYMTEPSGNFARWRAVAVGRNQKAVREYLESNYKEDLPIEEARKLAVKALLEVVDQGASNIEILQLQKGQEASFLDEASVGAIVKTVEEEREAEEAKNKPKTNY